MRGFITILIVLILTLAVSNSFGQGSTGLLDRLEKVEKQLNWCKIELAKQQNQPKVTQAEPIDLTIYDESLLEMAARLTDLEKELRFATQKQSSMYADLNGAFTTLDNKVGKAGNGGSNWAKNPPEIKRGEIVFGGVVHQQYYNEAGDNGESSFISKRARLSLKGNINEYASIKFQGEFAGTPKLLDGALVLSPDNHWSLCFGQYKPPFGTDFLTSASATPFVNRSISYKTGTDRDVGASVTYKNKINDDFGVKITAGLFNGSGINVTDVNDYKNFVTRIELAWAGMFTFAPNMIIGKSNEISTAMEDMNIYGGSVTWKWHNEIVEGEYVHSKTGDTKKVGWYLWGGHSFMTEMKFLPEIQVLARYEEYDVDLDLSDNKVSRISLGTNLFVDKKYTKLQFNYQINSEETVSVDNNEFLVNFQVAF